MMYPNNGGRDFRGGPGRGPGKPQGGQGGRPPYASERTEAKPIEALPIPADYLDRAEEIMRQQYRLITTSKLRRLLSLVTEVYNEENLRTESELSEESQAAVGLMRIRFAYEGGRDSKVKDFIAKAYLLEYLKGIGSSRDDFIRFAHYMEALVAYHRFFGGREN